MYGDLRDYDTCRKASKEMDYVFYLMAVKGNTQFGTSKVASGFVSFMMCNTNMRDAAFHNQVKRYLFVGSINEYPPLPLRKEDDVWNGLPTANDRFNGIAKRTGEEAKIQAYMF